MYETFEVDGSTVEKHRTRTRGSGWSPAPSTHSGGLLHPGWRAGPQKRSGTFWWSSPDRPGPLSAPHTCRSRPVNAAAPQRSADSPLQVGSTPEWPSCRRSKGPSQEPPPNSCFHRSFDLHQSQGYSNKWTNYQPTAWKSPRLQKERTRDHQLDFIPEHRTAARCHWVNEVNQTCRKSSD